MIQRIQTLYLILAGICLFIASFADYVIMTVDETAYVFSAAGFMVNEQDLSRFPYFFVVPFTATLSFLAIGFFKFRRVQLTICRINYLLVLTLIVLMFTNAINFAEAVGATTEQVAYKAGFFMPVPALVFLILAQRGMKKDEALIKSIDRLR